MVLPLGLCLGRAQGLESDTTYPTLSHPKIESLLDPRIRPISIFFPPQPPPLGQAISQSSFSASSNGTWYVNEVFYPALRARLVTEKMSPRLLSRLDQYHAAKRTLQNEIRAELDRLRDTSPAERAQALVILGRRQAPQITQLEATAESLRLDLTKSEQTWGALREWRLGYDDKRGYSPREVGQVMLAAAYFETGFSLPQRGLLREIYLELQAASDTEASAAAAQPYLFFSPAPARVLLPANLDADISERLAIYQTKKSALKKELYDTVYANDGVRLGLIRSNAFKALARTQAARLAELEQLAEEVRPGLADFVEPASLGGHLVSSALQARIGRMIGGYLSARKEATSKISAILTAASTLPVRGRFYFEGVHLKYYVVPQGVSSIAVETAVTSDMGSHAAAVRAEVDAVAKAYDRKLAELADEKISTVAEMEAALGLSPEVCEQVLARLMHAAAADETKDYHRNYRIAVFQPGLSPEQRRLFFDGVIEELRLPLPPGELQPTRRMSQ